MHASALGTDFSSRRRLAGEASDLAGGDDGTDEHVAGGGGGGGGEHGGRAEDDLELAGGAAALRHGLDVARRRPRLRAPALEVLRRARQAARRRTAAPAGSRS